MYIDIYFPVRLGIYITNIKCINIISYHQQYNSECHSTKYTCHVNCRFPRMRSVHIRISIVFGSLAGTGCVFPCPDPYWTRFQRMSGKADIRTHHTVKVSWSTTMSYTSSIPLRVSMYYHYHTRDYHINLIAILFIFVRTNFIHI